MYYKTQDCIVKKLTREYLESFHTKQLIKILRAQSLNITLTCKDYCNNVSLCSSITKQNCELIKDILKTRPHIPNKMESKKIRKDKIKKGK
jgi:hypothetical protein